MKIALYGNTGGLIILILIGGFMIMSRTVSKTQTPDATHTCEYKSRGAPTAYVSQSDCDKLNYGLDGVLIMSLVIVLSSFIGSKGWNPFHKKQQP